MLRRQVTSLVTLVVLALAPTAIRAQEDDVSGSWIAVQAERDGILAQDLVGHELIMENGRFAVARPGSTLYAGTYALDPVADPPAIDFVHEAGSLLGTTWEGIYELNGNRLVICDDAGDPDAGRPQDFSTSPGSGDVLLTFQRR
jgi:uncharacterized protein (TIGR03067 family)